MAQIGFFLDPQRRAPRELLEAWPSLIDAAASAAHAGIRVSLIQAAAASESFASHAVECHFVGAEPSGALATQPEFAKLLARLSPDVVHVHGLGFARQVAQLARLAPGVPILLQDHADRVPRSWRRAAWRRGHRAASAVAFCAREQSRPFVSAGLLEASMPVFEIPESTSRFAPGDQEDARFATALHGDPCVLWVGHLNRNKDPLTVLSAVRQVLPSLPRLQLWCCFASAELLGKVSERLAADAELSARVHLLGEVPHARVELLMRASDLYVSASHRESTGYALIEALACGLPPVVTDIPSFRALTGAGAVGALWRTGDPASLAAALLHAAGEAKRDARARARAHFDAELSVAALGRKLALAYRQLALGCGRTPPVEVAQ